MNSLFSRSSSLFSSIARQQARQQSRTVLTPSLQRTRSFLTSAVWLERGQWDGGRGNRQAYGDNNRPAYGDRNRNERPRYSVGDGDFAGHSERRPSRPPPAGPTNRIFVKNLPYDLTTEEFRAYFPTESVPGLTGVAIPLNPATNQSRGFGFLEFESVDDSMAYMEHATAEPRDISGRELGFAYADAPFQRKAPTHNSPNNPPSPILFVGGIHPAAENEELRAAFEPFGEVLRAQIVYREGTSKGFGHVAFADQSVAEKIIAGQRTGADPIMLQNRRLRVDFSQDREKSKLPAQAPHERLFFSRYFDSDADLRSVLVETGLFDSLVMKPKLHVNRDTGVPNGTGWMTFNSVDSAARGIEVLNGRVTLKGSPMNVEYARLPPQQATQSSKSY